MFAKKLVHVCLLLITIISECLCITSIILAFTSRLTDLLTGAFILAAGVLFLLSLLIFIFSAIFWKIPYFKEYDAFEVETWRALLSYIFGFCTLISFFLIYKFQNQFLCSFFFQAIAFATFYIDMIGVLQLIRPRLEQVLLQEAPIDTDTRLTELTRLTKKESPVRSKTMRIVLSVIFIILMLCVLFLYLADEKYIDLLLKLFKR